MHTRFHLNVIGWIIVLGLVVPAWSADIYVDSDAPGARNGSSWLNAFNYLQDGLVVARPGDVIKVAQGVVGAVVERGSLIDFIPYLANGLKHAFQDAGFKNIKELHEAMLKGKLRIQIRSASSIREGGVHDLYQYEKHVL